MPGSLRNMPLSSVTPWRCVSLPSLRISTHIPRGSPPRVSCVSRVGRIVPGALVKASRGLGGCGSKGPPVAGLLGVLGLGLAREVMPCSNSAYGPRLAAEGSHPRTPMISDHVGHHSHIHPDTCITPSRMASQQWQGYRKCPLPLLLMSAEKASNWAILNVFTPFSERRAGCRFFPPGISIFEYHILETPGRRGLSWWTPRLSTHTQLPCPKNVVMHAVHHKTGSPEWNSQGAREGGG